MSLRLAPARAQAGPVFPAELPYTASVNFGSLLNMVMSGYERPLDAQDLLIGALKGMLGTLDPYSRYLSPDEMKPFLERTEGKKVGVGLTLVREGERVVMSAVEPGGPADEAGLYEGLLVLRVGDVVLKNLSAAEALGKAQAALEGTEGSKVTVQWRDPVWGVEGSANLRRGWVESFQVFAYVLPGPDAPGTPRLCLMKITHLSANTPAQALKAVRAPHVKKCQGWLLDLRGNEGGDLEATRILLSHLRPKGEPLYHLQKGPKQERTTSFSDGLTPSLPLPLAVLVNNQTASGAELITQHLSTRLGVPVAGERTFGKGLVQQIHQLNNGGGFTLTVGRYFGLDGTSVAGEGIEPLLSFGWPAPTGASAAYDKAARGLLRLLGSAPAAAPPDGGHAFWQKAAKALVLRNISFDPASNDARTALWRALRVAHHRRKHDPHAAQAVLAEEDTGLPVAAAMAQVLFRANKKTPLTPQALADIAPRLFGADTTCATLAQHPRCLLLAMAAISRQGAASESLLLETLQTLAANESSSILALRLYRWLKDTTPPGLWAQPAMATAVVESALAARRGDEADSLLRPLLWQADPSPKLYYLDGVAGMLKGDTARVDKALEKLSGDGEKLERRVGLLLMLGREALRENRRADARRYYAALPHNALRTDLKLEALTVLWQQDLSDGQCDQALFWLRELASPTMFADPRQRVPHMANLMETALTCNQPDAARNAAMELRQTEDPGLRQKALSLLEVLGKAGE